MRNGKWRGRTAGRPPLPPERRIRHRGCIRVNAAERQAIEAKARRCGLPVATFVRGAVTGRAMAPRTNRAALVQVVRMVNNLGQLRRVAERTGRDGLAEELYGGIARLNRSLLLVYPQR